MVRFTSALMRRAQRVVGLALNIRTNVTRPNALTRQLFVLLPDLHSPIQFIHYL